MILVIVYVGAVAVLFLFVVMMLDIDFIRLREGFQRYAPIGAVVGGILLLELLLVLAGWRFTEHVAELRLAPNPGGEVSHTAAIGRLLYTDYIYLFQGAGLVLLVAMIGAIVLTHRESTSTRRQNIAEQVARKGSVALQQVAFGAGVSAESILRPPPKDAPKAVEHHDAHGHHGGHH